MEEDKTVIASMTHIIEEEKNKKKGTPSLVQYNGTTIGKRYVLNQEKIIVGRSPDCFMYINENSVSRSHAELKINHDGSVILKDLASANGTYVNDEKIVSSLVLNDSDVIRFGTMIFKFFSADTLDGLVQDKIYQMATMDGGTKIFNKQYMMDAIHSLFNSSRASDQNFSIIYFDLDFFKKVNDTYGHGGGDKVLLETCEVVKNVIRKDDVFCRYGGEEFVIILPKTGIKEACDLAERIRMSIASYVFRLDLNNTIVDHKQTVSLGVAENSSEFSAVKALLEKADSKLYQSKRNGRNQVTF